MNCGTEVCRRVAQDETANVVQSNRSLRIHRVISDLPGASNSAGERQIRVNDIGSLMVEKRLETSDQLELFPRKNRDAGRFTKCSPSLRKADRHGIFKKQ